MKTPKLVRSGVVYELCSLILHWFLQGATMMFGKLAQIAPQGSGRSYLSGGLLFKETVKGYPFWHSSRDTVLKNSVTVQAPTFTKGHRITAL